MARLHRYEVECRWEGSSTGVGYEAYDRSHEVKAAPARAALALSADPAFRGNPERLNPEQLVVAAASSCQLLSFLAVAARARIDVRSYEDRAEALMPEDDLPVRLTSIVLRPRITVARGPSEERVRQLVELAHRECYVANSLRTEVRVEPELHFV
ncbi:MAG TPA: OsmC family protein [Aggregicoccus sp.]|nr:OsmC family protein [Aggregicoccus sp.]